MSFSSHSSLLELVRCPVTQSDLTVAEPELLERVNELITNRQLANRIGQTITVGVESGLVSADRSWLVPIRGGIVVLIADQAIPLERLRD
jgi:uncharacterized protein YbaR (Trm112 family)